MRILICNDDKIIIEQIKELLHTFLHIKKQHVRKLLPIRTENRCLRIPMKKILFFWMWKCRE